jgi:hypothetical protein
MLVQVMGTGSRPPDGEAVEVAGASAPTGPLDIGAGSASRKKANLRAGHDGAIFLVAITSKLATREAARPGRQVRQHAAKPVDPDRLEALCPRCARVSNLRPVRDGVVAPPPVGW